MRIAVIGLGGVGACASWLLSRDGHAVVGLEQFEIDHDRGGSFGGSRIFRQAYADPLYTRLMPQAGALWEQLEHAAGRPLRVRCGGLYFAPARHPALQAVESALRQESVAFEFLDSGECGRRFPGIRLDAGESALYEPGAGILRASECVRAAAREASRLGAELRTGTVVERLQSAPDCVRIQLQGGTSLAADAAVVAAGPWTRRLLHPQAHLPIRVTRQQYAHFRAAPEAASRYRPESFPVWIDLDTFHYGFPEHPPVPGVKVAWHRLGPDWDPDSAPAPPDAALWEGIRDYASKRLPGLTGEVVHGATCLYENTPDEDFIVDRVPGLPRVCVVAGTSGHGFKFLPLLARLAASLAVGEEPGFDMARFRLARFERV